MLEDLVVEIYLKEKCSDVCIKCKFSQLPSRPRTVTSAVVLIYDAPFPFFFFFARGWNGAGCLERCCYFKILQSWWKVAAQRWIASFVIKTLQQQTHPGVLIGAINKCRLVNLFFFFMKDGWALSDGMRNLFSPCFVSSSPALAL